jgi:hypothetical protein
MAAIFVLADVEQVDDRLAARGAAGLGDLVDLLPVHAPAGREEQDVSCVLAMKRCST